MDRQPESANEPIWQVVRVLTFIVCVALCMPGIPQHRGADRTAHIMSLRYHAAGDQWGMS